MRRRERRDDGERGVSDESSRSERREGGEDEKRKEAEGERVCARAVPTRDKKRSRPQHTDALVSTTTTANMGAVVGTLTMQTKTRRLSRGEGICI